MTSFAGAERAVEGKRTRLKLRDAGPAVGARELLRVKLLFAIDDRNRDESIGEFGGGFDGCLETLFRAGLERKTIHHDLDGVILALVEGDFFVERAEHAIHAGAYEALAEKLFKILLIFAFSAANDGREDHDALAFRQRQDLLQDLFGALARDFDAASGAMRNADGGIEYAQVVVNFRDGSDRGARAAIGGFLLDGNGGAEAIDGIDFGALHLVQELAGVGRERFHVAALALGVDSVESKRGLAGAAESGDHGEGIARDLDVDVFEIVLASAVHGDALNHFAGRLLF